MARPKSNLKQVIMRIPESDWELLKAVAKETGSNASVEIRRFIKQYLAEHTDEIKKITLKSNNKEENNDN